MLADDNGDKLQWDLSKSFGGPENQAINGRIFASVRSTDTETSTTVIKAAMRVHFKTKCRQQKNIREGTSAEVLKMQRVRTRLNTKKNQRFKVLSTSTSFTAEQREVYSQLMTTDYMSSEHSMSESGSEHEDDDDSDPQQPRRKVFVVSTLPWRSNELGQVMRRLDKKAMRRRGEKSINMTVQRRREGVVSSRPAPDDAPAFALA